MIIIECFIFILIFSIMIIFICKDPIKTLYNYPPKIREEVKKIKEYQEKIPNNKNKVLTKVLVFFFIIIIASLVLKYINKCITFTETLKTSYLIWTVVNLYDVLVVDLIFFCHLKYFRFKKTENLDKEYRNYLYHIKEGVIGQIIGFLACLIIAFITIFIL